MAMRADSPIRRQAYPSRPSEHYELIHLAIRGLAAEESQGDRNGGESAETGRLTERAKRAVLINKQRTQKLKSLRKRVAVSSHSKSKHVMLQAVVLRNSLALTPANHNTRYWYRG